MKNHCDSHKRTFPICSGFSTLNSQFAMSLCLCASVVVFLAASALARPNIVFIYTDDQAPWALGLSGNEQAHTPHMDRLFKGGAYLVNSFTTTPVCSPSRASLMTSRYGTEVGITDWIHPRDEPELGLDPNYITWPEVLHAAGYKTALIGKWHLGVPDEFSPTNNGFDKFVGFREGGTKVKDPTLEVDGKPQQMEGLTVDILADHAIQFIRDNRAAPFLLCWHTRAPHSPWKPVRDEDWSPYAGLDPIIPNPDYPDLDVGKVEDVMMQYLASTTGVDRNVGRLLDTLEELELAHNTVVIFTSDHGYNVGHNGIWHKGNGHWITKSVRDYKWNDPRKQRPNQFDRSLRVPPAARWPGVIQPGTVVTKTVSNLDWYPTIVAMAEAKRPAEMKISGPEIAPQLQSEDAQWDNDFYAQFSQHHYIETHMRSYRTPEWKLIRDFLREGKDELYDLKSDPEETTNLIASDDLRALSAKRELNAKLLAKMKEIDDRVFEGKEALH